MGAMLQRTKRKQNKLGKITKVLILVVLAFFVFMAMMFPRRSFYYVEQFGRNVVNAVVYFACEAFSEVKIPLNSSYLYGIDVSYYQKNVDWKKVRIVVSADKTLPISFAYAKATEGSSIVDPTYKQNLLGAQSNNIPCGAYHFFSFLSTPESQAAHFLKYAQVENTKLRPALDFEITSKAISQDETRANILTWLQIVEKETGVRPIIYTNLKLYKSIFSTTQFSKYDFWIARFDESDPNVGTAWQFSEFGKVKGISGAVDLDLLRNKNDLKILRKP